MVKVLCLAAVAAAGWFLSYPTAHAVNDAAVHKVAEDAAAPVFRIPEYCPAYVDSALYRPRANVVTVAAGDRWIDVVEQAIPGTEVLFEDGTYRLNRSLVKIGSAVTLRSASGNSKAVTIVGSGYTKHAQGLVIAGDDVTIAELTITRLRDHGVYVKPDIDGGVAPHLYGLNISDIGTQHIKANSGSRYGLIACSTLGYSEKGAVGDYNGAIDLHGALAWTIRDNRIYNIAGDGSGCNVNRDCGRYISAPAILVWNQSRDTVIERNTITESFRNIALGLGTGHEGGVVRDNTIIRTRKGDAGIELQGVNGTLVKNNTVLLQDKYRGAIEYRQSRNLVLEANTISSVPWNRGGNSQVTIINNTVLYEADAITK